MNDDTPQPGPISDTQPEPTVQAVEQFTPTPPDPYDPAKQAAQAAQAAVTNAAAHGILSKLESEFESEFRKGESSFKNWYRSVIAELKAHLKV